MIATKIIYCLALSAVCTTPGIAQRMSHVQLRAGVYLISGYHNGNMVAVEGRSGVLLIDAQSAQRVAAADTALRALTGKAVATVINTHYHEDHMGGNAYWRARGARVIAHASVAPEALKDTTIAERNWRRTPLPSAVKWVEAAGNYVKIHTPQTSYMVRQSLSEMEELLDPATFARIHRSAIANLDHVKEFQPWFSGEMIVVMEDGSKLKLSRTYRQEFEARHRILS